MRRLEKNGEILIRALLISGLVIGMTQIVGNSSSYRTKPKSRL